ncbi:cytochrome P450 [Streptomonospora salina]|uniref:Cytochrome P450 n=1 Tax=Streptomonospora salina TaxID=104205 RepID=A0A841ECM4_9ACTN|nr:cytochrome P450 [Streptomonospora salina]MBB5998738.1 cytochrome P450 [Streptomonospora salina]
MPLPPDPPPPLLRLDDPALDLPTALDTLPEEHFQRGLIPVELEKGVPAWLMITLDCLQRVLKDEQRYARDPRAWHDLWNGTIPATSPLQALYPPRKNALSVDGTEHTRLREAVTGALEDVALSRVPHQVSETADVVIDGFCTRGEADVVSEYASVLPLLVLCRLFGMDQSAGLRVGMAMQRLWDGQADAGHAHHQLQDLLIGHAAHRRAHPGRDITTGMITRGLDDEEIRDQLALIMAAAHDPIAHTVTNTLADLLQTSRLHMVGSTWLISETLNHGIWHHPPLETLVGRFPTVDGLELGGYRLRRGDCLVMGFGAAQRHQLRTTPPGPSNRAYPVFGMGPHGCPRLGRDIALSTAQTGVERLQQRLPDLRLSQEPAQRRASTVIAGRRALPVTFTPARPLTAPAATHQENPWNPSPAPRRASASNSTTPPPTRSVFAKLARWLRSS